MTDIVVMLFLFLRSHMLRHFIWSLDSGCYSQHHNHLLINFFYDNFWKVSQNKGVIITENFFLNPVLNSILSDSTRRLFDKSSMLIPSSIHITYISITLTHSYPTHHPQKDPCLFSSPNIHTRYLLQNHALS